MGKHGFASAKLTCTRFLMIYKHAVQHATFYPYAEEYPDIKIQFLFISNLCIVLVDMYVYVYYYLI